VVDDDQSMMVKVDKALYKKTLGDFMQDACCMWRLYKTEIENGKFGEGAGLAKLTFSDCNRAPQLINNVAKNSRSCHRLSCNVSSLAM
jgi:hypothetical protein